MKRYLPALIKYPFRIFLLLFLSALLGLGWLVATESGLQQGLKLAEFLTGERLRTEGAQGRLIGPLEIRQLSWHTADLHLVVQDFQLEWLPQALWQRHLHITSLKAKAIDLSHRPGPESPPPEDLTLPFALTVDTLELGSFTRSDLDNLPDPAAPTPLFTGLEARLESDGQTHKIHQLQLHREALQINAQAKLGGQSPFPLEGALNLNGTLEAHAFELMLKAEGSLNTLMLNGQIQGERTEGKFHAVLSPLTPEHPVQQLEAQLSGINPKAWYPQAPTALLDLDLNLQPLPGQGVAVTGTLDIKNHRPGPVDRQNIPVEHLNTRLRWADGHLQLSDLQARLPGAGRFIGNVELTLAPSLRIQSQGEFRNLDPARLGAFPQANLNSRFRLTFQPAPEQQLNLDFQIQNSRIAGHQLNGQGQLDWTPNLIRTQGIQLRTEHNRLEAQGALALEGNGRDRLRLDIQAPRLAEFGLPPGDLSAQLDISGSAYLPRINGTASSHTLEIPGILQMQALSATARMGTNPADPLELDLKVKKITQPESERGVTDAQLSIEGTLQQHRIQWSSQLEIPNLPPLHQSRLHLSAQGKLRNQNWQGTLEKWDILPQKGNSLMHLEAPSPLSAGQDFQFGPARFTGPNWQGELRQLSFQNGIWKSRGKLEKLPLADFFPAIHENTLRLSADWDLSLGNKPEGYFNLWRTDGDLQISDHKASRLGLTEAHLGLKFNPNPTLNLLVEGNPLGQIKGELRAAGHDPINQDWHGVLNAHMQDIAWISPLLGAGTQLGGKLAAEVKLSGSPRQPLLEGRLKGDALQFRALDSGLRLESGQIALHFSQEANGAQTLTLEQFAFDSPFSTLPRTLDKAQQTALAPIVERPGRITGKGHLQINERTEAAQGQLDFTFDRMGVMQNPRQWIALSGTGQLGFNGTQLNLGANLKVDGAHWELADLGTPQLSDDVVVIHPGSEARRPGRMMPSLDVLVNLGPAFHFSGVGVSTLLRGELRVQGSGQGTPSARGVIRTFGGRFNAYGQQLSIEQGILTFSGPVNNPGLNIRAMRTNQAVEAGVSVTGTARRPVIQLVSNPNVPDVEKLSWLILGEPPDQGGGGSAILLAAANAILGGQNQGPGSVLRDLQQTLGVNVSVGQSSSGPAPTSQVAASSGFGNSAQTGSGQVVRVGTRLASDLTLSYEQSLAGTESFIKLTLALTRRLSLIAQAGTDNAVNLFYNFRFGEAGGRRQNRTDTGKPPAEPTDSTPTATDTPPKAATGN